MQLKTKQAFKEAQKCPPASEPTGHFFAPAEAEGGAAIRIHIHPNRKKYPKKTAPPEGAGGANQSPKTLD